jgi:hypothetical protein
MSDVKIKAIRDMYDGFQGDRLKLDSGEFIHSWILFDENGEVVNPLDLDDVEISEAYETHILWEEFEYENVG